VYPHTLKTSHVLTNTQFPNPPPPTVRQCDCELAVIISMILSQEGASDLLCFYSRRGVSNMALQEYDLAEKDLILARKLEPANR
jgi:hypothetical protein